MRCFTDENNPATLKLLIAANFGQVSLDLEFVNIKEWKTSGVNRLPTLELKDGSRIFASNTAAWCLFKQTDTVIDKVDVWLDWEASVLRSALQKLDTEKLNDSSVISVFNALEKALKKNKFIIGDEISLADIVLWSSLFSVLSQAKYVHQYLSEKSHTMQWFEKIKNLDSVKSALITWGYKRNSDSSSNKNNSTTIPNTLSESEEIQGVSIEELKSAEQAWLIGSASRPKPEILSSPVLPKIGKKNVLITSALPYVNNVPHLGNIIGCVLSADVFARFCRLRNWNTLYIAGTDEYGTATETKALEEKMTPQEICDKYYKIHKETYSWFNIAFDHFGRTTTNEQKTITQELFMDLYKKGFTSVASMEQLHCESCNRFLADRFVEGTCPKCKYEDARGDQCDGCGQLMNAVELIEPRCKLCNRSPVVKSSDQLFLELPKVEPVLQDWIKRTCSGWSHNAQSITNTWLKDGLKARCITRDLKWGTPVPLAGFENKVFYVWFDAPIGYLSITACYTKEWRKWWQPTKEAPVTYFEFMAKDNVPFHSVMFPSTLLAIDKGYLLVNHIMATEYLNYEDGKFSKSRGIGVFGTDAKDTGLSADVFRFYLLYVRPESQDSSFSWEDLAAKHNTELLNNVGNFVNRALTFTENFFQCIIPKMTLTTEDFTLLALVTRELQAYNIALEKGKLKDGIKYMLNISRHGNQYMQNMKPWVLIKGSDEEKARAGTVIGLSSNVACLLAIIIQPYMPSISETMREQMNVPTEVFVLTNEVNMLLPEGHKIGKPAPLFAKIEVCTVNALKIKFGNQKSSSVKISESSAIEKYSDITSLEQMEALVTKQGELVRQMKNSGLNKNEWMPQVEILKDMKKHLEGLKNINTNDITKSPASAETPLEKPEVISSVIDMEAAVAKQGELVRNMKSSGKDKREWMPHVEVLKDMKKQLEELKITNGLEMPNDPHNLNTKNGVHNAETALKKENRSKVSH